MNPAKIKVIKGCLLLDIRKGMVANVISIQPLGPDYSYQAKVTLQFPGRQVSLYARHTNQTQKPKFNLSGMISGRIITVVPVAADTPVPGTCKLK